MQRSLLGTQRPWKRAILAETTYLGSGQAHSTWLDAWMRGSCGFGNTGFPIVFFFSLNTCVVSSPGIQCFSSATAGTRVGRMELFLNGSGMGRRSRVLRCKFVW
jgi:hypothetical protein